MVRHLDLSNQIVSSIPHSPDNFLECTYQISETYGLVSFGYSFNLFVPITISLVGVGGYRLMYVPREMAGY